MDHSRNVGNSERYTFRRGRRTRWLDIHNLLGIVTVCWILVVGVTGAINALDPLIAALCNLRSFAP